MGECGGQAVLENEVVRSAGGPREGQEWWPNWIPVQRIREGVGDTCCELLFSHIRFSVYFFIFTSFSTLYIRNPTVHAFLSAIDLFVCDFGELLYSLYRIVYCDQSPYIVISRLLL